MLSEVISKQISSLEILNLSDIRFSSNYIEKLLTPIAECGSCSTLKELILENVIICDSSDACNQSLIKLADILAINPVLKKCDFRNRGVNLDRRVRVTVEYATEGKMGTIKIWNRQGKTGT